MPEQRLRYINVYAVTRHYGGPEEGGWWYNSGSPIESRSIVVGPPPPWVPESPHGHSYPDLSPHDMERIRAEMELMEERYESVSCGDIYSVLGGVEVQVDHDEEPGKYWPEERPYYC